MPNPDFEGVTDQIKASLKKAGGDPLVAMGYETKVKDGSSHLRRSTIARPRCSRCRDALKLHGRNGCASAMKRKNREGCIDPPR
jgi:hypothetical protein